MIKLDNVSFTLKAKSDIYIDEELQYESGTIIETVTTDSRGIACFQNLGSGLFEITEESNLNDNYIINNEPILINLNWDINTNLIDCKETTLNNDYQTVKIKGEKQFETLNSNISISIYLLGLLILNELINSDNFFRISDVLLIAYIGDCKSSFTSGNFFSKKFKNHS